MKKGKEKIKIAVIGGSGEFGRVFASFFKKAGYEVTITGRNEEKGKRVAREYGFEFTRDNIKAAKESDFVIFSLPIDETAKVIKEVAPHVREGCLISDTTSVKEIPCKAMLESTGKGVEIIGMHPMFGPRVTSLEGNVVILTPVRISKSSAWLSFLVDFFEKNKARVVFSTPEEHDRLMSIVQVLTHFSYITAARTIRKLDVDVEETRKLASPVYELMLDLIARIVGQNPWLYASIQMYNKHSSEVQRTFIEEAEQLSKDIARKDKHAFVKKMKEAAKIFRDIDSAMGKSDKAIAALTLEIKKLKEKEKKGKKVLLRHIYSGNYHYGRIKKLDPDYIVLESNAREKKLKISNVELVEGEEEMAWKRENLEKKTRDFSAIFPESFKEELFVELLKKHDRRIISCEVIDVFRSEKIGMGKKSITIRVKAIEFNNEDFERIEEIIEGMGGKLR